MRLPATAPAACGANDTDRLALPFEGIEIGRLGPTKLNPLPDVVACEIIIVYLLELVIEMGMIRLLPTAMVPKLAVDTCTTFTAAAKLEIVKRETSRRPAYTSLRGDPRRFIFVRFLCTCLRGTAGDFGAVGLRGLNPIANQCCYLSLKREFPIGHRGISTSEAGSTRS